MEICVILFICYQMLIVQGKERINVDIESSVLNRNISRDAAALRYGFHKTWECQEFDKAFLCIQKCLDLNYDIAYSNKRCSCTCYYNRYKAKYTVARNHTLTRWKSGAPTTSLPPWAKKHIPVKGIASLELSDKDDSHEKNTINKEDNVGKPGNVEKELTKSPNTSLTSGSPLVDTQSQTVSPKGQEDAGKPDTGNAGEPAKEQTAQPANEQAGPPATDHAGQPANEESGQPATEPAGQPATEVAGQPDNVNAGEPANEQAGQPTNEHVSEPTEVNTADPKPEAEVAAKR